MRAHRTSATLAVVTLMGAAGCGGHRLADYDFGGRSVAVVYFGAPAPELRTGGYDLESRDPLGTVVAAGGRIAREVEARRARARLDSAATRVDLATRLADRTLERASRYLGARPVEDRQAADYLLEVDVHSLGLDAGRDEVHLFVSGEAVLLDARSGVEIWDSDVRGWDPLTPELASDPSLGDILTAGALRTVTVDEFERILGRLADYTADRIARELRADLRDVRR
ncbi:MAG: hypothetical protein GWM90_14265 [Gemmatimonadetes bacterium]|nr:hypothetical protein [Gemmatimonadota bacterium]NIQ55312.1 hypothetical protein [Gemmatimonadota bacterium]NIU75512.1 hypothetical protein [Gammaproteobacteria bacterium]NIX45232.1 hypothetical protein [Gemmatimonadota bacterium]NIY09489.1 hypothetical protein [Gemmatimonadota bacterium]